MDRHLFTERGRFAEIGIRSKSQIMLFRQFGTSGRSKTTSIQKRRT
ncbi:MAG: hypothetical protein JWN56_59 [Sphingobacteriales bacterium]|nr:hypothetical protein [Sphingobacteriales bacterium]